ncbi:MAG: hypothetical protein SCALA702_09110 [Melioribacteraceae bacterium]|nr:MAG: hypothetical protein SCALA702_09110 [Melioribacteraceae bacterium]
MNLITDKYYNSNRNGTADLLKGLAVLLMIQVHITELFIRPDLYNSLYGKISLFLGGPPAAPLFMLVMGFFLAGSKRGFTATLKRGGLLIIGGLLLNLGLNANLLYKIYSGKLLVNQFEYIFGVDILFLAGLSVISVVVIKKIFNDNIYFIVTLLIITVVIHPYLPQTDHNVLKYINAYFYGDYTWGYFPFLPWFGYVLSGYLFHLLTNKWSVFDAGKSNYIIIALSIGLLLTFGFALDVSSNLEVYYHHEILFFIWTVLFLIVISYLFNRLEKKYGDNKAVILVKFLGQNVTLAYVFQWLIIGNIATEVFKTFSFIEGILSFFGVTLLTYLLIYLYRWTEQNYFNTKGKSFSIK